MERGTFDEIRDGDFVFRIAHNRESCEVEIGKIKFKLGFSWSGKAVFRQRSGHWINRHLYKRMMVSAELHRKNLIHGPLVR